MEAPQSAWNAENLSARRVPLPDFVSKLEQLQNQKLTILPETVASKTEPIATIFCDISLSSPEIANRISWPRNVPNIARTVFSRVTLVTAKPIYSLLISI